MYTALYTYMHEGYATTYTHSNVNAMYTKFMVNDFPHFATHSKVDI